MYIMFIVLILIALGIVLFFYLQSRDRIRDKVVQQLKAENQKLKQQLAETLNSLKELKNAALPVVNRLEEIKRKIPDFSVATTCSEKCDYLNLFWNDYYGSEQFFKERSKGSDELFRELQRAITAGEIIRELQQKVTTPFYETMDQEDLSVEEVRACILKMAMQLYDVISTYQSVNKRNEQRLNISIVKNEKSEEEAFNEAKQISDFETETPRWIRRIASGLKNMGIEDKKVIISGYRLTENIPDQTEE